MTLPHTLGTGIAGVRLKPKAMEELQNTLLHPDDIEPVQGLKESAHVTWDEVEDENLILNPDPDSMQGRG